MLLTSYALSSLVFSIPAGLITDRMTSRRLPFFIGLVLLIASTVLLAVGQTILVLIVARVLQGMSAAVVWTVGLVLLRDTVGKERLGTVLGGIFGFISVGNLISPVLGGIIYDKIGDKAVFGLGLGLLLVDLVLRAVVVERSVAERWKVQSNMVDEQTVEEGSNTTATERSPLLPRPSGPVKPHEVKIDPGNESTSAEDSKYVLPNPLPKYLPSPLLYIFFTSPRLMMSTLTALLQSTLVAINDTTIPLHALDLFGFTPLRSGLLFIPLLTPLLVLGPLIGYIIDKNGTKLPSAIGFLYLSIPVLLLGLPHAGGTNEVVKYAVILLFCGVGSSSVSAVSLVEVSDVAARYHDANPGVFGDQGPFALVFAWNSVVLNAGFALGPMMAAWLIDLLGYWGMNACMSCMCVVVGVLCFFFMGDTSVVRKKH